MSAETRAGHEGRLMQAEASYRHAPSNVDSLIWYARRLGYLGRFNESIEVYTRGIERHPSDPWLYRHRGHRYITVRQLDRAVADLETAARLMEGVPDQVELDGIPNAHNQPIGTLRSNVWYHLALANYLRGDFARAVPIYQRELAEASNDDRRVSAAYWLYLTLRRLGREAAAAAVLRPIGREMNVIENDAYHRLLLLYRGDLAVDSLLPASPAGEMSVADATTAYGVASWLALNGRSAEADALLRRIIAGGQWPAFGFIAAEADLARGRGR